MGCACGGSKSARIQQRGTKTGIAPRIDLRTISPEINNQVSMAPTEVNIPDPLSTTDADKRRIKQLQKQAIQKNLGRLF
jgi:hypothetical protein